MFIEIIEQLLSEKGVSKKDFLAEMNMNKNTFSAWKGRGTVPSGATLQKIADYFGVSVDYLLGNEKKPTENSGLEELYKKGTIQKITYRSFPVLGGISCGKPKFADEERETITLADCNIDADFILYADGDSMIGARIMAGDIVFIKSQPIVDNGEIAAVMINDEATLKRVYYYPEKNKLVLQAENPKYEPLVYVNEELDEIKIIGKAVAFQSSLK